MSTNVSVESEPLTPSKGRIWWEIAIVLGIGLGQSAIYAIVALAYRLSQTVALGDQEATLNPSLSDREIFDFIYQMLDIIFSLGPVVLVCFLLWRREQPHLSRLGLDTTRVWRDTGWGVVLVVAIGIPGLAIYLGGRALGLGVAVDAAGLDPHWWTIPVLLLSALRSGIQEEVVVLGYLFARLQGSRLEQVGHHRLLSGAPRAPTTSTRASARSSATS